MTKKMGYYVMLSSVFFMVTQAMADHPDCRKCDVVVDGVCNAMDAEAFYAADAGWGEPKVDPPHYPCDINEDGECDDSDYEIFTEAFARPECEFRLVECELVPDETVIPRGEALGFTLYLDNKTDQPVSVGVAADVTLPDGTRYPPNPSNFVIGPTRVSLEPHEEKTPHVTHDIHGGAQLGTYSYSTYVLRPGAVLVGGCNFEFEVVEADECVECKQNSDCGHGEYCQKSEGECTEEALGRCSPRPSLHECRLTTGPLVCGCDGGTYGNACFAARHGVTVYSEGRCSCQ
jgi:Cys-rich repeat protein